jgi:hypothetical protein
MLTLRPYSELAIEGAVLCIADIGWLAGYLYFLFTYI